MSANIQQRIEAAERELAEAKRLLAAPADSCAYTCREFETFSGSYFPKEILKIKGRQRWTDAHVCLSRYDARELRRILNIFLGESHQ